MGSLQIHVYDQYDHFLEGSNFYYKDCEIIPNLKS